ncbi:pre-mRNA-splicing factor rse1 [Rhizodiscina lignyota]|uniref:Pre-mRNA-splicing factor rse1 n=1 Tax=Rhizodiscina lignyota TaxID=1504668 RepID=A0A9P4IS25_9PEZI|nr:pre-mRNA-splicing factor rse1 [Rhizodiscina lignyota]
MATTSSMFMYSLTIKPPTAITQAVQGQFSGTKEQQLITACGSYLTLYRPGSTLGSFNPALSRNVFGIIRTLSAFRLSGTAKDIDFLIVGSDSGRITILEYKPEKNTFKRVHLETFGKSGIRRVVPGQYLATDPKGRACMMASVEKNKIVYVLNRNAQAELTISSPLEAHKPQTLVFALVGLDVGYENPIFAALEVDYSESEQDPTGQAYLEVEKQLVYYELDLGLNHVVRKWTDVVDRTANMLLQVPGGSDGPSGVLVCGEESITYRHSNQDPLRVDIPRRQGATEDPGRKRYIVAGLMHKMRDDFFFLVQTEDGDLFKVKLQMVKDENEKSTGEIRCLTIKYFETVPVATSIVILRSGFLFVATETGKQLFYAFEDLSEGPEDTYTSDDFPVDPREPHEPVYFRPGPRGNIFHSSTIDSMNPVTDCKVANLLHEDAPQIYTISGTGARSNFNMLKHGLGVDEFAESALPGVAQAVWTTKKARSDPYDSYIILTISNNQTFVLSLGANIEEVTDTGFLTSVPTLAVQLLGDDALLQVHPRGIRHILPDGKVNEWGAPQHRTIVAATTNEHQVAIALSSGEVVYFEVDNEGNLAEYQERREMAATVTCLSLGEVPPGRIRSEFLAVGCADSTVRIFSVDPENCLEDKSVQALTAVPSALHIMPMADTSSGGQTLFLHIGLHSGVYLRVMIDEVTGDLSDTRTRFLGPQPVKLSQVSANGQPAILALSSQPWLGYAERETHVFKLTPLNYRQLEWGWNLRMSAIPEGIVAITGDSLRILTVESLTSNLLHESIPLTYTPRHFVKHPHLPLFYVIEADNNTMAQDTRTKLLSGPNVVNGDANVLPPETFGYPRGKGHWASCVEVVDPFIQITDPTTETKAPLFTEHFEPNEAAISVGTVTFASKDEEAFLVVGTGVQMTASPPSDKGGYIHLFRFVDEGRKLEWMHKSKTEAPPRVLQAFQGRLLVGMGRDLRIYDFGVKQLLRKTQAMNVVPNLIVGLATQGFRIVCADIQESVMYCVYKYQENSIVKFCDDSIARWNTCSPVMVDYDTAAAGDKFGNIWFVRCPKAVSDLVDEEGSTHLAMQREYLQGTEHRVELMVHFCVHDIPTSVHKTSLVPGGRDVVLWSGLQGTLGILVPFVSREDVELFQQLQSEMRKNEAEPPLAGRDHLAYRSYYAAEKGCIDGDLCERFVMLPREKKEAIAVELDNRSVREIERKIADFRTRAAF